MLLRGGFVWDALLVSEVGAFFVEHRTSTLFSRERQAVWYAVHFAVDCHFLETRKTTESGDGTRLWKLRGMNGWQGAPRSETLGGKYDLESKGSAFSCTPQQESKQLFQHRKMEGYVVFKGGGVLARLYI